MIDCSAIYFYLDSDVNHEYPIIMTGFRHADIYELMFKFQMNYDKGTLIEGFLDNGKFFNRYDAQERARYYGQIPYSDCRGLYSEDIWPEG